MEDTVEVMKLWMLALEIVTTQLIDNTVEVMESWMPHFKVIGCTGNSDGTSDGGHGGSNEVMDAPLLRSLGDGYSTSDGHHNR